VISITNNETQHAAFSNKLKGRWWKVSTQTLSEDTSLQRWRSTTPVHLATERQDLLEAKEERVGPVKRRRNQYSSKSDKIVRSVDTIVSAANNELARKYTLPSELQPQKQGPFIHFHNSRLQDAKTHRPDVWKFDELSMFMEESVRQWHAMSLEQHNAIADAARGVPGVGRGQKRRTDQRDLSGHVASSEVSSESAYGLGTEHRPIAAPVLDEFILDVETNAHRPGRWHGGLRTLSECGNEYAKTILGKRRYTDICIREDVDGSGFVLKNISKRRTVTHLPTYLFIYLLIHLLTDFDVLT